MVWFCHSPRLTWLIRSTQGIWNRHFDFGIRVIGITWLDFSLFLIWRVEKNACRFSDALRDLGRVPGLSFVAMPPSPLSSQRLSLSAELLMREHCLWYYSWGTLNKIFLDIDLCFITEWKWLQHSSQVCERYLWVLPSTKSSNDFSFSVEFP